MEFIFWLCLILIGSSYFGYPLLLMILARLCGREVKKAQITPSLSLLVPAYNEEKVITQKIENCLALNYPKEKLEIIVASESTDRTNEFVKEYSDKGVKLFAYSKREGKAHLIHKTVPQAQGEFIVFTDANAVFSKDALLKLMRNFAEPEIGCVCGELKYVNPEKTPIGQSEGWYWRYEIFLKKLEGAIRSVLGANGSIYALKKELYSPLPGYPGCDFELPVAAKQQGYDIIFEPEAISYEQVSQKSWQEFRRKIRSIALHLRPTFYLLKKSFCLWQPVLIFQLLFHKILRWFVPLFLILIFLSNLFLLNRAFYQLTMFGQIAFYAIAVYGWRREKKGGKLNKAVNLVYYFSMVNLAALVGLFKGVLGKQKPYWEKVR